jgi:hypothetical protein
MRFHEACAWTSRRPRLRLARIAFLDAHRPRCPEQVLRRRNLARFSSMRVAH